MIKINRTTLDLETTFQVLDDGRTDPSPFNPANKIVAAGFKRVEDGIAHVDCLRLHHKKLKPHKDAKKRLQDVLDNTELLVGHHLKFDLQWLVECGFTYDGPIYDTLLGDYVINQGLKLDLDLDSCLKRHGLEGKAEVINEYYDKKISFEHIPWGVTKEYNLQDVEQTDALFLKQLEILHGLDPLRHISLRHWHEINYSRAFGSALSQG